MRSMRRAWRYLLGVTLVVAGQVVSQAAASQPLRIRVWKAQHKLDVLRGSKIVRTYRVSLGASPVGPKMIRGDGKTPVGVYSVYDKRPSDRFRWFLALNYPAKEDADRAFAADRISADTWADIWLADKMGQEPPWNTPLGAFVGIHGTGAGGRKAKLRRVSDWTDGCIAVSDRDIDELYEMIPVGTVVEIRE
jgi:murein L,D-transpeptidase YafK